MRYSIVFSLLLSSGLMAQDHAFSPDFEKHLRNNYPGLDFAGKKEGFNASFGGKTNPAQPLRRRPVVLVHGSTDRAIGGAIGGWQRTIAALLEGGYQQAEVYALTWGNGRTLSFPFNRHSKANISTVRYFIEAVLDYTGTEQIDVLAHSMGVTLSRAAIDGGLLDEPGLQDRIRNFVGIAGLNLGSGGCLVGIMKHFPMCSLIDGLHPKSALLFELNDNPRKLADKVYSIWSHGDKILNRRFIGGKNRRPSSVTSPLPYQDKDFAFNSLSHFEVRDETTALQLDLLK